MYMYIFLGPAGTGKTESVKALGCQLGRFVLVFNCDETFDFQVHIFNTNTIVLFIFNPFRLWDVFLLVSVKLVLGVVLMSLIVWKRECYLLCLNRYRQYKKL